MVNPLNRTQPTSGAVDQARGTRQSGGASEHTPARSTANAGERLQVSSKAQLAHRLNQAAIASDGVDPARVQAIRDSVAGGAPKVSAQGIAGALLNHAANQTSR